MPRPIADIDSYHAHVYFDDDSRAAAVQLREQIEVCFEVALGRWHEGPVGPHSAGMYQVAFETADFHAVVPWLMLNRGGLSILVHPNTGNEVADHAVHPLWLGEALPLDIDYLRALEDSG